MSEPDIDEVMQVVVEMHQELEEVYNSDIDDESKSDILSALECLDRVVYRLAFDHWGNSDG